MAYTIIIHTCVYMTDKELGLGVGGLWPRPYMKD